MLPQFEFLIVSFQINVANKQTYLVPLQHVSSFVQLLFVVCVKLSDKLLNYFIL